MRFGFKKIYPLIEEKGFSRDGISLLAYNIVILFLGMWLIFVSLGLCIGFSCCIGRNI
jgi:hypothetical protein